MSKTIEFVNRKIKDKKEQLKRLKNLKTISNKYELQINELLTKNIEEDIDYLEQIKCELEAWEITKENTMGDDFHYEINIYKSDKGYNKFKKGLEIEDGKNKFE